MNLARTTRGTIHTPDCHYAGMAKRWLWADRRTPAEVVAMCRRLRSPICKHCKPLMICTVYDENWQRIGEL